VLPSSYPENIPRRCTWNNFACPRVGIDCSYKRATYRFILLLVSGVISAMLFAQAPPNSGAVDLSAPSLQVHATLPWNNFPTFSSDLIEVLNRAQATATEKGIASDTLIVSSNDEGQVGTRAQLIEMYRKISCFADAIVIGHTDVWLHHLTPSRTNIYTDYDFVVEDVVKNNGASTLYAGKRIVLTRPGGSMQLGAGTLKTVDVQQDMYPHLQANTSYLIFLNYIPASGGYEAKGPNATFVGNSQWTIARKSLSGVVLPELSRGVLESSITNWLRSCGQ
jgi:hypothetical protein